MGIALHWHERLRLPEDGVARLNFGALYGVKAERSCHCFGDFLLLVLGRCYGTEIQYVSLSHKNKMIQGVFDPSEVFC